MPALPGGTSFYYLRPIFPIKNEATSSRGFWAMKIDIVMEDIPQKGLPMPVFGKLLTMVLRWADAGKIVGQYAETHY